MVMLAKFLQEATGNKNLSVGVYRPLLSRLENLNTIWTYTDDELALEVNGELIGIIVGTNTKDTLFIAPVNSLDISYISHSLTNESFDITFHRDLIDTSHERTSVSLFPGLGMPPRAPKDIQHSFVGLCYRVLQKAQNKPAFMPSVAMGSAMFAGKEIFVFDRYFPGHLFVLAVSIEDVTEIEVIKVAKPTV